MNINKPTPRQRANLEMALVMWTAVPPESVVSHLESWACGTQACFGGHLGTWEYFMDKGVRAPDRDCNVPVAGFMFKNEPYILGKGTDGVLEGLEVAEYLFGFGLFHGRGYCGLDSVILGMANEHVSDHELVLRRLELALFGELVPR